MTTTNVIGLLLLGLLVYFTPTMVARDRRHVNVVPIFVLNLLLGWTLLGWVVALVWALTAQHPTPGNAIKPS